MSGLRAKVLAIRAGQYPDGDSVPEFRAAVLALIPEGAVLVTEETLAAALPRTMRAMGWSMSVSDHTSWEAIAAAILAKLREAS